MKKHYLSLSIGLGVIFGLSPSIGMAAPSQQQDIKFELGRLHRLKKDYNQAKHYLDQSLKLSPTSIKTQLELALVYFLSGQKEKGLLYLESSQRQLFQQPNQIKLKMLGYYYRQMKYYKQALKVYGFTQNRFPSREMKTLLAQTYREAGQYKKAKGLYTELYTSYTKENKPIPKNIYFGLKASKETILVRKILKAYLKSDPDNYHYQLDALSFQIKESQSTSWVTQKLNALNQRIPITEPKSRQQLAYLYTQVKENTKAEAIYRSLLKQSPDDLKLHLVLGELNLKANPKEALLFYHRAYYQITRQLNETPAHIKLALGFGLKELKQYSKALAIYQGIQNKTLSQNLEVAYLYQALNRPQKARTHYIQIIHSLKGLTLKQKDQSLYKSLGYNLLKLEEYQLALPMLKQASQWDPSFSNLIALHEAHLNLNQSAESKRVLDQAARKAESNLKILKYLALQYRQLKSYSRSNQLLEKAHQLSPSDPEVYLFLGDNALSQKQSKQAYTYYKKAQGHIENKETPLLKHLAYGYLQTKAHEEALPIFITLETSLPEDYDISLKLGHIYRLKNELENTPKGYLNIAEHHYLEAEKKLKLKTSTLPLTELAFALFELKKYSRASRHFETLKQLSPQNHLPPLMLGHIYRVLERYRHSALNYSKAIQLDQTLPEAHFNLGLVNRAMYLREETLHNLEQASKIDTELKPTIQQIRTELYANGFQLSQTDNYRFGLKAKSNELFLKGDYILYHQQSSDHQWKRNIAHPWDKTQPEAQLSMITEYEHTQGDQTAILNRHALSVGAKGEIHTFSDQGISYYKLSPELKYHYVNNINEPVQYVSGALSALIKPMPKLILGAKAYGNLWGDKDLSLGSFLNYGAQAKTAYQLTPQTSVSYIGGLQNFEFFDGIGKLQSIYKQINIFEYQHKQKSFSYQGILELNPIMGGVEDFLWVTQHELRWHIDTQWDVFGHFNLMKYMTDAQKTQSFLSPAVGVQYKFPLELKYPLYIEAKGQYLNYFENPGYPGSIHYGLQLRSYL